MSAEQRRTDDYWQAYWGERFKSENEGYQHTIAALEARLANAEAERDKLKSQFPYVEASGHYCDGMTAAWTDAQIEVQRAEAAEAALVTAREALESARWQASLWSTMPFARKITRDMSAALAATRQQGASFREGPARGRLSGNDHEYPGTGLSHQQGAQG